MKRQLLTVASVCVVFGVALTGCGGAGKVDNARDLYAQASKKIDCGGPEFNEETEEGVGPFSGFSCELPGGDVGIIGFVINESTIDDEPEFNSQVAELAGSSPTVVGKNWQIVVESYDDGFDNPQKRELLRDIAKSTGGVLIGNDQPTETPD